SDQEHQWPTGQSQSLRQGPGPASHRSHRRGSGYSGKPRHDQQGLLPAEGGGLIMYLNDLRPAPGSRPEKDRPGRGIGSGLGKTGGRGHKGQTSRSGGTIAPGFEGGQQPLHRRLPKFGFTSLKAMDRAEVRTSELAKVDGDVVSVQSLKDANIVGQHVRRVKVMLSGDVGRAVTLQGVGTTKGARAAIEAAGG